MFVLRLNDMRTAYPEILSEVARAETEEALSELITTESVDLYIDGDYSKVFRKGSTLEWCNPPLGEAQYVVDVGTADDWAANARMQFNEQVMELPLIGG